MKEIDYVLVRSHRKTLALTINSQGQLVVRAPLKLKETIIQDFIRQKAGWVAKKQEQVLSSLKERQPFTLAEGATVPFLGKDFTVRRVGATDISFAGETIRVPERMTTFGFTDWLRLQAASFIRPRVDHYAGQMNLHYASIRMSEARRRWGSCGAKDTLNFAWRLVMCPPWIIDYVVVHELAHIAYKNHGPRFWAQVAAALPDYKKARDWLRANSPLLEMAPLN